ncbi:MAG: helix-turn-helix domain-containing protein [Candidatus Omnitrophica bacterium]|nr:helix-turn-helix domain-containing protein [Candidatus Omnitrophota bacterium]
MSDKLLTLKELAHYLGIDEDTVEELIDEGIIPAYKIGGSFIRCRKEQVDAIRDEITAKTAQLAQKPVLAHAHTAAKQPQTRESFFDVIADFFYFNDFYIVCFFIIAALLYIIVKL